MSTSEREQRLKVVEICAGAGGQTLGLHRAGFDHDLAVELDETAARTLRHNLHKVLKYSEKAAADTVRVGDVADPTILDPNKLFNKVDLLAGGVPCPPFSIAGKQLGSNDERDLFAWAIKLCGEIQPKALLLENVRGLSTNRFAAYRQEVLNRLKEYGYIAKWYLLEAHYFGVSQLRPRFVLIALKPEYAMYFDWDAWWEKHEKEAPTVGKLLEDLMKERGWEDERLHKWVLQASDIAPTIVGGSKKHGGADLGPTRAKRAWAELGVDALGLNDLPPHPGWDPPDGVPGPKLTVKMVARLQGWDDIFLPDVKENDDDDYIQAKLATDERDFLWVVKGRKTAAYRQIGNAFPPPVAKAIGESIKKALLKTGEPKPTVEDEDPAHDRVYNLLRESTRSLTVDQIITKLAKSGKVMDQSDVERHLNHISQDFVVTTKVRSNGAIAYSVGEFKAFTGQHGHRRHDLFTQHRTKIS